MTTPIVTEPSDDELLQAENEEPNAVPVCIDTPVNVRELPSKTGGMTTFYGVTSSVAVKALPRDYNRKSATVIAFSQDIYIGNSQSQAQSPGSGARWPANVPLMFNALDELWVCTVTGTSDISVIVESWAN